MHVVYTVHKCIHVHVHMSVMCMIMIIIMINQNKNKNKTNLQFTKFRCFDRRIYN